MERYLRQIALSDVGVEGQNKLMNSSALLVGVGGLGSPIATYLAASGIGRLGIIDPDKVSLSNLSRQVLYSANEVGMPKVDCAKKRLLANNPNINIDTYDFKLDESNAFDLISKYDSGIDGTDNAITRYIIDTNTYKLNKPYIYGAINGLIGQVSVFNYKNGVRYNDLYPKEYSTLDNDPPAVLATTVALVGVIETNEALKVLIGFGEALDGKLLTIDLRDYKINIFNI